MPLLRRAMGALSRRLERPELLAALYADARREEHEEVAIAAIFASTLRSDSCYVDVGANRGQLLRKALRIAPRGRHLAFEPIPALDYELYSVTGDGPFGSERFAAGEGVVNWLARPARATHPSSQLASQSRVASES